MYTVSKEADKRIKEDLKQIIKIAKKELNPDHLIFFGGFGHGGGSFKKVGKKIIPLNDYDFYVVSNKKYSDEKLEEVGEICSRKIGAGGIEFVERFNQKYDERKFFHVDFHPISYKKLKNPFPTQRIFDIKTSKVVYGNPKVLNLIPNKKISKSDALRLLFNKLNHFEIAKNNSEIIRSIYAVKGLTDLTSALLIWEGKYTSRYQDKVKELKKLSVPKELKDLVEKATKAKLYKGYKIENLNEFEKKSKKWVEWTLKTLLKKHLKIKSNDWPTICKIAYKKLPYLYFKDYLPSKYLFPAQYYMNLRFFNSGLRKKEFLLPSILRWRDPGLTIALSLILYSYGYKKESKTYLKKLTFKTKPLRERILTLYSIYYLQKVI